MAYCTLEDILKELDRAVLIELTDDPENPTGLIGEANVTSAIERAGAVIDGFLRTRMDVPASPTPTLVSLCTDIAIYTLYSRKENVPEIRVDRYTMAMDFLKGFSDGKSTIGAVGDGTSQYPRYSSVDAEFGVDTWDRY